MDRLLVCLCFLALTGCAGLQPRPPLPAEAARPIASDTELDRRIGALESRHPGASGFRLVSEGSEAFVLRAGTAMLAERSLDVQTYIWHADLTGIALADKILAAADRGVRVRLLVDDMSARGNHYSFAALDAHPHIEVRLFNPFQSRAGRLRFMLEALGDFKRINRRMHNKSWIADNRIALVGGRNLGDEYFNASEQVNFVDLDFVMIGPIVREVSASFDRYWNSEAAYPVRLLAPRDVTPRALDALRAGMMPRAEEARRSRYAESLAADENVRKLVEGEVSIDWASTYRFVADDPLKASRRAKTASQVLEALGPMMRGARQCVNVISPYFVPGKQGADALLELAAADVEVNVLTNSLAANDVAAVYGGYSRWRRPLLEGGVNLWELKPVRGVMARSSLFGSSGASLHTKALMVDGERVFVGSYNLDPRSTSLNTEQGVFVEDAHIAAELDGLFRLETAPARAWRVTLDAEKLRWSDGDAVHEGTPDASFARKLQAWLARMLRIDAQL